VGGTCCKLSLHRPARWRPTHLRHRSPLFVTAALIPGLLVCGVLAAAAAKMLHPDDRRSSPPSCSVVRCCACRMPAGRRLEREPMRYGPPWLLEATARFDRHLSLVPPPIWRSWETPRPARGSASSRSTSATLQACAMHPRGRYGGSASNISLIDPTQASFMRD
jgi:hypothetical protein